MSHKISLTRDKRGLGLPEARKLVAQAVRAALKGEGITAPCEVSVLLTDDEGIHALNLDYRGVDSATDVLSFPTNDFTPGGFDPAHADRDPSTDRVLLGDMALSLEHAESQGAEFGHGVQREIQYLTVHSVLHLLGYDHVDEADMKRQMRAREKAIMALLEGTEEA